MVASMEVLPDARPPLNYLIVAEAVVFDDAGRVALVRNRGKWWLPGGRVERGETIFEAVAREVGEEAGLDVTPLRIISLTERLAERHELFVVVECRFDGGDIRAPVGDAKVDAARWADVAEAAELVDLIPLRDLAGGALTLTQYRVERPDNIRSVSVHIEKTPAEVGRATAAHVAAALRELRGPATLGLAGGSTPGPTYRELATSEVPWEDITMWLGDERWVAHHHPESNVGMVRGALVEAVNGHLLAPNHGIGDPVAAAAAYETALGSAFVDRGLGRRPDVVLLGVGDDGHTASLFPETAALDSDHVGYLANWVQSKEAWRLTATLPLLWSAGELVFIVTGENKGQVVKEILIDAVPYPAQRAASNATKSTWFLDEAAAAMLD